MAKFDAEVVVTCPDCGSGVEIPVAPDDSIVACDGCGLEFGTAEEARKVVLQKAGGQAKDRMKKSLRKSVKGIKGVRFK
tara:strand:+ start:490 stop:726 length:237 start_codon:yes stop_codon:yes gene_type:complete